MNTETIGIIEAANKLRDLLPCEFNKGEDFMNGVKRVLHEYLAIIKSIDESQFNSLIKKCNLNINNLTKKRFFNFASLVTDAVIGIIETYLDGNPYEAYRQFDNLFRHNKVKRKLPAKGYKYLTTYMDEKFVDLFCHDTTQWEIFYRIRIGKDILIDDMYHVPFNKREYVGTYRFSIPGWPAFYIGTSVDVCWDEVKRDMQPDENVYVARLETSKPWIPFSLQIPPMFQTANYMAAARYLYYFMSTFPVFAVSLIKVRNTNWSFKPEYIIPQMILQFVKTNSPDNYHGIIYSSTKCQSMTEMPHLNIVIPTKSKLGDDGKYSKFITDNFKIVGFKKLEQDDILLQLHDFQNIP